MKTSTKIVEYRLKLAWKENFRNQEHGGSNDLTPNNLGWFWITKRGE
jgi:hypothetical protein